MRHSIQDGVALSRAPEGPLAAYMGPFARSLSEQGYSLQSIHRQALLAACFSQWLKQQGVALRRITLSSAALFAIPRSAGTATSW